MANQENLINDLLGSSTVKRRKSAIAARQLSNEICKALNSALEIELGSKSWQTQVELVVSLGELGCKCAQEILKTFVFGVDGTNSDIVTMRAATALIRVTRSDKNDYGAVRNIIDRGEYAAIEGAFEALGYDKMVFDDEQCASLIRECWDFGKDRQRGLTDPRYGLAAACAGWNKEICSEFLAHCLESNDVPLIYVAKNSLKSRYVKLR